jgi:hypothetical protein
MKFLTLEVSIANKPPTGSNGCLLHAQPNHFWGDAAKIFFSVLADLSLPTLPLKKDFP